MRLWPVLMLLACCKQERIRTLVEDDRTGSGLALAACRETPALPVDACKRVAIRYAARLLAQSSPDWLQCEKALAAVLRFAPEKLPELDAKCCPLDRALCKPTSRSGR